MDTEYSYLYEDKYYENAVKNLKSTFYDVIEREEIMLNNLENRIASETDEGVKARLLELWTKQNDSLDKSIVNFRHIKQSIRVLDSFVKELGEIDEQIVADIINSTNVIRSSRIEQIEKEPVENTQQEVNNNEVVSKQPVVVENVEVQEQPAVVEKVNVEVPEQSNENEVEIAQTEEVQEQPKAVEINEEKIVEEAPTEENVTIPEEKVKEEKVVEESNVPDLEIVNEENDGMDLPNVVEPQKIDPESMKEEESSQQEDLSTEEIELPFKVEAIPEEEQTVVEDTPSEEVVEEAPIEENAEEVQSDESVEEDTNTSEVVDETTQEEVPVPEQSEEINNGETVEEPQLVVENVNEEVPLEEGFIDEPVMEEIPSEDNNTEEQPVMEEVPVGENTNQETTEVVSSNRIPLRLLKTDLGQPKAIVVNETQFDRLYNSFERQEKKFFDRGYLTTDLVANNNYVLGNMFGDIITDDEQVSDGSIQETEVDMEQMLEQANELYKAGRVQEAQELIDKVTEMNRNKELVKAA